MPGDIVYEAIETPNTFIFVEEWTSFDGLYAHFHTPHFTDFFAALGEVIAEPPTRTVSEVSSTKTLDEAFAAAASADNRARPNSGPGGLPG